ncbi:hypothetical protein HN385_03030 [archaeon]|jgi:hypothetical protein|nr:hypothetical protein [archaeon]MBT3450838.1 hypothetical protein [archaeon]MBT6868453.1 hypothetical protein [archaeon]MBT7193552.1 hypothetical protein [archaeon]MBT7381253.1 hypothetical protein [archaeon]
MYQTTQSYCIGGSCTGSSIGGIAYSSASSNNGSSGLEYITNEPMHSVGSLSSTFYSASATSSSVSSIGYIMSSGTGSGGYISSGVSMPVYLDPISGHDSYGDSQAGFSNYSLINISNSVGGRGGGVSLPTYELFKTRENYHFIPDNFIVPGRSGMFVGDSEEVRGYVEDAFEKMFEEKFPSNIKVSILGQKKFAKIANNPGAIGLSINRNKFGMISEIFILNDNLARVMLTIGHELGHVLSETLPSAHDEEAKAYAFSMAWMKVIQENDIAGLGDSLITENPANNGLHDIAFNYVVKKLQQGKDVWKLYLELVKGKVGVCS